MINLFKKSLKSKGFTLIELLVVVAIIGLLASIVIVGLAGVRSSSRDTKGKADMRQIQTALELCYQRRSPVSYPTTGGAAWANIPAGQTFGPTECNGQTYMSQVPITTGVNLYQWIDNPGAPIVNAQDYGIRVSLEDPLGCFTITPRGVVETTGAVCPP